MGVTGRVVGAVCAGLLMDAYGLGMPFVVSGIVMLSGALIFAGAYRLLVPTLPGLPMRSDRSAEAPRAQVG